MSAGSKMIRKQEQAKVHRELLVRSAQGIPEKTACKEGVEGLEALVRQLREGAPSARVAAAIRLQGWGGEAVPSLCEALEQADPRLREVAAESLGDVGDERAVRPLLEALHRTRREIAADQRRTVFLLVLAVLGGLGTAHWLGIAGFAASPLLVVLAGCGATLDDFRRRGSPLSCRIAEALGRIAERRPAATLRAAIPVLEEVRSSFAQQDSSARDALLGAAHRIDALTAAVKQLPRPAEGGGISTTDLPRIGTDDGSSERVLPRVSPKGECCGDHR